MDNRERILTAAARVYSQYGFRGATTRLIAQEADVNEVTLFRIFGSKEALIEAAMRHCAESAEFASLPEEPVDPERELTAWCASHMEHMRGRSGLIRACMADFDERPEVAPAACAGPVQTWRELQRYLRRLRELEMVDADIDLEAAGAMFMGAAFGDAMGREMIREMFPGPVDQAAAGYTRLFLRAISPRLRHGARRTQGREVAARNPSTD
jgi:AcrR family transcriptional regulator